MAPSERVVVVVDVGVVGVIFARVRRGSVAMSENLLLVRAIAIGEFFNLLRALELGCRLLMRGTAVKTTQQVSFCGWNLYSSFPANGRIFAVEYFKVYYVVTDCYETFR